MGPESPPPGPAILLLLLDPFSLGLPGILTDMGPPRLEILSQWSHSSGLPGPRILTYMIWVLLGILGSEVEVLGWGVE